MKHNFSLLLFWVVRSVYAESRWRVNLAVFCVLLTGSGVFAQDLMYLKKVKDPIPVKIHEIGLDEIKYKPWGDTIIPILVIPRENVSKLVLANGQIYEFKEAPMMEASEYIEQHPNAIKFSFLSPLFSSLAFSYERSIRPGRSFEVGLAFIGAGVAKNEFNALGMHGRIGYKFITSPDYYLRGMKYSHILKGGYIKPEILFGGYGIDRYDFYYSTNNYYSSTMQFDWYRRKVTFGGLIVNFGKQWVIDDLFIFDFFMGLGYGFSTFTSNPVKRSYYYVDDEPEAFHYAFLGGTKDFPVAISAGFKIGIAFGKQKNKNFK